MEKIPQARACFGSPQSHRGASCKVIASLKYQRLDRLCTACRYGFSRLLSFTVQLGLSGHEEKGESTWKHKLVGGFNHLEKYLSMGRMIIPCHILWKHTKCLKPPWLDKPRGVWIKFGYPKSGPISWHVFRVRGGMHLCQSSCEQCPSSPSVLRMYC